MIESKYVEVVDVESVGPCSPEENIVEVLIKAMRQEAERRKRMIESKYHSRKLTVDGRTFDSRAEANRYRQLVMLQRAGKISALACQVRFTLQDGFKKGGKTYRPIVYVADFTYTENGRIVVEDVKGVRTKEYLLKKKLFEKKYPNLTITEVEV